MAKLEVKLIPHYEMNTYQVNDGYFLNYYRSYFDAEIKTEGAEKGFAIPSIPLCSCPGGHNTKEQAMFCKEVIANWTNLVVNRI